MNIISDITTLWIQPTAVQRLTKNSTCASGYFFLVLFLISKNFHRPVYLTKFLTMFKAQNEHHWFEVSAMSASCMPFHVMCLVPNSRASVPGHDSLLTLMSVWMNDCDCWIVSILLENCFAVFLKHVITDRRNSIDIKCASISEHYVSTRFIPHNTESKTCACRL